MTKALALDLRVPLGLLFSLLGLLLSAYGIVGDHAIYAQSLGVNLNLWCGLAMILFGAVMLVLSRRSNG